MLTDLHFGVLGPLELWSGRQKLPLGGPQQRTITGYLLIHANEVVATSQIVMALWPDGAPSTARKMLQNSVSHLRGVLADHGGGGEIALLTHPSGYLLRSDTSNLDLLCFEDLAREGSAAISDGQLEEGARVLRDALDLWRGFPLTDLHAANRWPELTALRQRRLTVFEDYFENELVLGRHHEHLAELEKLVMDDPNRERAARLLMLALYRSGRQVDALAAYQRTRTALIDTMGLEPTRELRELERAILDHDSALHTMGAGLRSRAALSDQRVGVAANPGHHPSALRDVNILTIAVHEPYLVPSNSKYSGMVELILGACAVIDDAGGAIQYCTGSIVQAVFGVSDRSGLAAAVGVASDLLDRFQSLGRTPVNVSVRTERAPLISHKDGTVVYSVALEQSLRTVRALPPGEVWICENTRIRGGLDVLETASYGEPEVRWSRLRRWGGAATLPFLDRENELVILDQYLGQTVNRERGRTVAILGEAGIGKSRLVTEWLGRLDSPATPPVILRALSPCGRSTDWEEVSCVQNGRVTRVADRGLDAEHLIARVREQGPTILVLEDIDLKDMQAQEFIRVLDERAARLPLLTVATARAPVPDWSGSLMKNQSVITLGPLSDRAIEGLWVSILGQHDGRRTLTDDMLKKINGHPAAALRGALNIESSGNRGGSVHVASRGPNVASFAPGAGTSGDGGRNVRDMRKPA